jgi:hypothetical protein
MTEGEIMKPSTALLTSVWGRMKRKGKRKWIFDSEKAGGRISTSKVRRLLWVALRSAGMLKRPYVLRRLYETEILLDAAYEGLVSHDYAYFFAGHAGPVSHRYMLHKALLADEIEKMRQQYRRAADKFLVIERREGATRDEVKAACMRRCSRLRSVPAGFRVRSQVCPGFPE